MPTPPFELVSLRYRQRFHLSPAQMNDVPMSVMQRDLAILALEAEVIQSVSNAK